MATATLESKETPKTAPRSRQWAWLGALLFPVVAGPVWIWALQNVQAGMLPTLSGMILVGMGIACSYTDLRWHKIHNWVTYPVFLWAWIINIAAAIMLANNPESPLVAEGSNLLGAVGLLGCFMGSAVCFFIMLMIYRMSGGGAGDVKLAAAAGALLGPSSGLTVLVYTYITAGAAILVWAIWKLGPLFLLKSLARKVGSLFMPGHVSPPSEEQKKLLNQPVPLALFFAVGIILVVCGVNVQW